LRKLLLIIAAILFPNAALAHPEAGETVSVLLGFVHPFRGLDHIVAMLAVGVLAAVAGGKLRWPGPLTFIAMMTAGFLLSQVGAGLPLVEEGIAVSGVVLLVLAVFSRWLGAGLTTALVGMFAVLHGYAHGLEMDGSGSSVAYVIGFVAATATLHLTGMVAAVGGGALLRTRGQRAAE
jgi:urease accessory protein